MPLYQEHFFEPDETGVLAHILAPNDSNDEQSVPILLQLLTQLHPVFAVQEFVSWISKQLIELAQPYPVVTQAGWKALQRASVLLEFNASEQILGVQVPLAEILPEAVVLQGPSSAINELHSFRVPIRLEQDLG